MEYVRSFFYIHIFKIKETDFRSCIFYMKENTLNELMTIYKIISTTFEHILLNYLYKPKLYVVTFFLENSFILF